MAAPYNPPKKNEDFIIYICLEDMENPGSLKSNPTIASGDFVLFGDGSLIGNLGTTPTVTPASNVCVKITLANTEMNYDNVVVVWRDQTTPKEWPDGFISIPTTS